MSGATKSSGARLGRFFPGAVSRPGSRTRRWALAAAKLVALVASVAAMGCQTIQGSPPKIAVRPSSQEELADVRVLEKPFALAVPEDAIVRVVGPTMTCTGTVIDDDLILGKPSGPEDAAQMISRLSGRTHEVWTRFAIGAAESPARSLHEETVKTRVTFRSLTAEQVRAYVATGEGIDKAGAYAIQGRGAGIVSRIEGSYANVVGLPACEVVGARERLGLWQ